MVSLKWYSTSLQNLRFSVFYNVLFILFPMSYCTMPRASQEDLIHSFKSYSDVTMFHYTIPKEVLRATWQFAAFMDDLTCQPRKVYIHLKFGSYPIITKNNNISVKNMYTEHDDSIIVTTITTYQSKNTTLVPVYGPQPGDWFVAAYMPYWNEKVQQQGLEHKCQYSIGTVVLWSQEDNIENIPVGYKQTLRTSATTTYYKIYIPSKTWSFRLSVWNCSFTLRNLRDIRESCIDSISLRGRALPILNQSHSIKLKNLTMNTNYTFVESSPYEDSYYYLSIVSNSVIEFNVKIDISECPIKLTEKFFTREYINTVSSSNSVKGHTKDLIKHKWYYQETNVSSFYSRDEFYKKNKAYETDNLCVPRHQLGEEWLSSRLMLTDSVPVMLQFDILPLIDIGGILDINLHLEVNKMSLKQSVVITICIQRGRVPKLENYKCQSEALSLYLSSLDKQNTNLSIAYPQPDTWYIITHARCYNYDNPTFCQVKEIFVLMNIRTKNCMHSNQSPCGNHGICQEIQKNILHYATCNCFKGTNIISIRSYTGWDCTEVPNTIPIMSSLISTVLLILSNIFFIPAIYIAVKRDLYAEGLVYLTTMIFSSIYHACDQNGQFCIAKYEILQYSDFFSSILAFWVTLVAMAELPTNFIPLCHMAGVFVINFVVQIDRMRLISILIPLSMGIAIPIFRCIYKSLQFRECKKPSRKLLFGLLLVLAGLLLYSFSETEENYQYVHSIWHIVMATSLIFLLPSAKLKRTTSLRSITFYNYSESTWSYKESYSIPTFTIIDQENHTIAPN
ncbi:transmembrane protein 8A-like isoform X3 [Pseudomyrmex gracilis]|uniref:transmembrane protein 8A-like isoform X3 n=1 Tax=Pseudomyrmex gracilis TaxID=219809 RepID=UPI000994B4E1|nr:transmembrane protein 8A-like isoform X3 [Pseudomyrmex gracilis]